MAGKYIAAFLVTVSTMVMGADQTQTQTQTNSFVEIGCVSIAGEYLLWGMSDSAVSVSFLEVRAKPSRKDARWFLILDGGILGEFMVWTYGDAGQVIGEPIRLAGRCMRGKWEEKNSHTGNSDGTLVKGDRTWLYYLDTDGSLKVDFSGTSTMQYFPGITTSPKSYSASAHFGRRN